MKSAKATVQFSVWSNGKLRRLGDRIAIDARCGHSTRASSISAAADVFLEEYKVSPEYWEVFLNFEVVDSGTIEWEPWGYGMPGGMWRLNAPKPVFKDLEAECAGVAS